MQSAGLERTGTIQGPHVARPQRPQALARRPSDKALRWLDQAAQLAPALLAMLARQSGRSSSRPTSAAEAQVQQQHSRQAGHVHADVEMRTHHRTFGQDTSLADDGGRHAPSLPSTAADVWCVGQSNRMLCRVEAVLRLS